GQVPEKNGRGGARAVPALAAPGEGLAVGGQGERPGAVTQPLEPAEFLARGDVPRADLAGPPVRVVRVVAAPGDQDLAIGREDQVRDLTMMGLEPEQFPARGRLPHADRAVLTARGDPGAVRGISR